MKPEVTFVRESGILIRTGNEEAHAWARPTTSARRAGFGSRQTTRPAQESGVATIDQEPRQGGDGRTRIGFLHPRSTFGVLTELEEDTAP